MRAILAALALAVLPGAVQAQALPSAFTGSFLAFLCAQEDREASGACLMFLQGALQAHAVTTHYGGPKLFCPPADQYISNDQYRLIFLDMMRADDFGKKAAEDRAIFALFGALTRRFPCR